MVHIRFLIILLDIDNNEFHVEIFHVLGNTVDLGEGGSVWFVLLLKFPLPEAVVEVLAFGWGSGTSNIVLQPKKKKRNETDGPCKEFGQVTKDMFSLKPLIIDQVLKSGMTVLLLCVWCSCYLLGVWQWQR